MPAPSPTLFLAAAVLLAAIATGFGVARLGARRSRRHSRRRVATLERELARFLDSKSTALALRRAVRSADPSAFWAALETLSLGLGRAERARLSGALERNPFAAAERRALEDDSPWRAELAARRLSLLRSPASRRALRRTLARGPEVVSLAAAMALARDRDARALRWIVDHPETLRRRGRAARTALLRAFGRGALPVLAESLQREAGDGWFERSAIEALAHGRYLPAAAAIERRLRHPDMEVRAASARALGWLGAGDSTASILGALEDEAWQVRAQAARALGLIGASTALVPLASALTDRAWWVRRHAAYALRSLGPGGIEALSRAAARSPDPYAREMAREALEAEPGLPAG